MSEGMIVFFVFYGLINLFAGIPILINYELIEINPYMILLGILVPGLIIPKIIIDINRLIYKIFRNPIDSFHKFMSTPLEDLVKFRVKFERRD